MLSAEAVRGLQEELFSPKSSSKGRKKKKPRGKKNALARPDHLGKVAHRQKPKRRLTATTEEEALDELVPQSHKSAAAALAVSQLLDQRKRDYLSAEMFKVMNSKKEWVGSPSSSLQLTFSSTANFHIINKQDLLNHDRFRSNPKFNNIIARGAYLQRCVCFRKLLSVCRCCNHYCARCSVLFRVAFTLCPLRVQIEWTCGCLHLVH